MAGSAPAFEVTLSIYTTDSNLSIPVGTTLELPGERNLKFKIDNKDITMHIIVE